MKEEDRLTFSLTVEEAQVLAGAARYMAKKKRKEANRRPFVPEPGHYNLNERNAMLLSNAVKIIQKKLDERIR